MPSSVARGRVRRGSLTSPATSESPSQPSYANIVAVRARPNPIQGDATSSGAAAAGSTARPPARHSSTTAPSTLTLSNPTPPTMRATIRLERMLSSVMPPTHARASRVWVFSPNPKIAPRLRTLTSMIAAVATGPSRMTDQAQRNETRGPKASRRKTVMPPERGMRDDNSAITSAPHTATTAPTSHTRYASPIEPVLRTTTAGDCRIPTPITPVTSNSPPFQTPTWRGKRLGSAAGTGAGSMAARPWPAPPEPTRRITPRGGADRPRRLRFSLSGERASLCA